MFNDPVLDQLIADADANNTDIKVAGLRVIEARAQLGIAQSGRYPQVQQASADALYLDRSQSGGRNPRDDNFWQYFAGFDVAWELDFWGRFRRAIESADANYFAAYANYEDVLVLLHAQLAETYMALRTTEARLRIARDNTDLQQRSLEITEQLFKSGNNAELDLQQAKTQYLGTKSTIPELESALRRTRNATRDPDRPAARSAAAADGITKPDPCRGCSRIGGRPGRLVAAPSRRSRGGTASRGAVGTGRCGSDRPVSLR